MPLPIKKCQTVKKIKDVEQFGVLRISHTKNKEIKKNFILQNQIKCFVSEKTWARKRKKEKELKKNFQIKKKSYGPIFL